ncbi:MAG: hypothetical protein RXO36_02405 [Candidatus Nanopusillus acidilobi]
MINSELKKKLGYQLFAYYNFENILILLVNQNYNLYKNGKDVNDYYLLTSPRLIINILYYYNYQYSEQQEYLKNKYKNNKLWQELKETAKKLNPYNLTYIIERVRTAFDTYFTCLELYEQNPNLFTRLPMYPVAGDFSELTNYSIELDKYGSLSFIRLEKENLIGINLSDQMLYIPVTKEQVKKLTEMERLFSVKVVYDNGDLYLQISYLKELNEIENKQIKHETKIENKQALYEEQNDKVKLDIKNEHAKFAGIDIGTKNLMAVFIDDETTPSLLISGKPFKHFKDYLENDITKLCNITKFMIEYLQLYGVTDLFTSKNLLSERNSSETLFEELIRCIEQEAKKYGLQVHYVDESYTSQVSCITGDIKSVQGCSEQFQEQKGVFAYLFALKRAVNSKDNPNYTDDFNGKRINRDVFFDTVIKAKFNADLNAAVNHIKVGTDKNFEWLKDKLFKLKEPIKITSDQEFEKLLVSLKKSNTSKPAN